MKKIVVTMFDSGMVDDVLCVENYDDKFMQRLAEAEHEWQKTDNKYENVVYPRLREYGYSFEVLEYESVIHNFG